MTRWKNRSLSKFLTCQAFLFYPMGQPELKRRATPGRRLSGTVSTKERVRETVVEVTTAAATKAAHCSWVEWIGLGLPVVPDV